MSFLSNKHKFLNFLSASIVVVFLFGGLVFPVLVRAVTLIATLYPSLLSPFVIFLILERSVLRLVFRIVRTGFIFWLFILVVFLFFALSLVLVVPFHSAIFLQLSSIIFGLPSLLSPLIFGLPSLLSPLIFHLSSFVFNRPAIMLFFTTIIFNAITIVFDVSPFIDAIIKAIVSILFSDGLFVSFVIFISIVFIFLIVDSSIFLHLVVSNIVSSFLSFISHLAMIRNSFSS